MGKPAARLGDMHLCPIGGTPPHVGGPITGPCASNVLIGGAAAAVVGDLAICTGVGAPDPVILGSSGVFIGGKQAARKGDICAHGGAIVGGFDTVLIGEQMPGQTPVITTKKLNENSIADFAPQVIPPTVEENKEIKKKKSWIEFELVDEKGIPVCGEKYVIMLPDGSVRKGMTNISGNIRIDGIDPGECKIKFLEIDCDSFK